MAAITDIVTVLPPKRLDWTEVAEQEQLPDPERDLVSRLGIEQIRDAEGRSSTDLAAEALRLLLGRAERDGRDEPGALLLMSGRHPELLMASEATRAQRDSGMRGGFAVGVADLGCASVSAALLQGRGLLAADPRLGAVALAHGSRPPGPRRYRSPVTLNGDGAMAVSLGAQGPLRIVDLALETNGEYWDLFRVDYLGRPVEEWTEVCGDPRRYAFSLAVESRKRLARMNRELLARAGVGIEDVDHVVTQNLSSGSFDFYEQTFEISLAQACRTNLRAYGHVGATDIGLNLRTGMDSGEFQSGDLVLVMNNSPVAAWSTMLVEVTGPLPAAAG
ncbi:3-oxoacyl-[acyl-carrier-protein] synthase III C-terminal domain-containing protein [Streptacidiphilus cavernicola]|uniref:3-oxoacyl-[acyl-carrier-protein] synthase III C-terminal domain-containing protein n=1 Tax=Streptacidiphilus cavernicola TaxID=3342716 RepID=A0ABV6W6B0_9ACTN